MIDTNITILQIPVNNNRMYFTRGELHEMHNRLFIELGKPLESFLTQKKKRKFMKIHISWNDKPHEWIVGMF